MIKRHYSLESWLNVLLYLGFIVIIFLMATSLFITIKSSSSIKQLSQELHNRQINQTMNLLKLEQNLTLSFSQLSAFLITGLEKDKEKFNQTLTKVIEGVHQSIEKSGQSSKKVSEIISLVESYQYKSGQVIRISGDREKNYIGIFKAAELLNPSYLQFIGVMEQLIDDELAKDDIDEELLSALIKAQSSWYRMVMSIRVFFTTQGELDFEQFQLYKEQNTRDFKALEAFMDSMDFESVFIEELISYRSQYVDHLPEVLTLYRNDKWRYDIYLLKNEIYPLMSDIHTQIRTIVDNSELLMVQHMQSMQNEVDEQVTHSKWIFIISITLGIAIVLTVGRKVSEIVQSLAQSKQEASEHLIKANERARELETTSKELRNSLNALKDTQEQLIESEKMAALGGLVAGVAHEINTPLGIGITSSSYLSDSMHDVQAKYNNDEMTQEDFEQFLKKGLESTSILSVNLNRAADLVSSFKQIAVDQSSEEHRRFKLDFYLDEIILSLRPKFRNKDIQIKKQCPESLEINGFPGAISQIMTNLILNSLRHGFEHKDQGCITINVEEVEDHVTMIKISYSDDGIGIAPELKNKIFEPFYTTKRNRGGSGIGMSLVYNLVVQKLCGTLSLESEPDKGVCFTILIPKNSEQQGVCQINGVRTN